MDCGYGLGFKSFQSCQLILLTSQIDCKAASFANLTFHFYAAPVQVGQLLSQRQPETGTFILAVQTAIYLHKRLKQALQIFGSNTDPIIDDRELNEILLLIAVDLQYHLAIFRCEFDRICEQIHQDLFETPWISKYFRWCTLIVIGDCNRFLCG